MIPASKRQRWWFIAIAITAILVIKTYIDDTGSTGAVVAETTQRTPRIHRHGATNQEMPALLALEQIKKTRVGSGNEDLFRSKSWYIPPPPPPPALPPKPVAPPLPFSFLGKVKEPNGRQTLFLSDQNRVYLVHGGETLDKKYHVDGIKNGKLAITYLPLNKKQYLNLVEVQ